MMDGWIKEFWALSVGHHLWPIVNPWMRMNTHLQPCPNPHFMSFYLEYHQVNCGRMVQRYPLFSFCLWVIQQASTWGHGLGHRHRDPKVTTMSSAIHICLATLLSFFMPPFILTFWTVHTIYCLKGNNLFFLFFVFFYSSDHFTASIKKPWSQVLFCLSDPFSQCYLPPLQLSWTLAMLRELPHAFSYLASSRKTTPIETLFNTGAAASRKPSLTLSWNCLG